MLKLQILYSTRPSHPFPATYQGRGDTSAFPSQPVLVHLDSAERPQLDEPDARTTSCGSFRCAGNMFKCKN